MLFDESSAVQTSSSSYAVHTSSTTLGEKGVHLSVLADVGHAMAFDAEAGEELDQISVGSLAVQVCDCHVARNMREE